jgi:hypothetical protein
MNENKFEIKWRKELIKRLEPALKRLQSAVEKETRKAIEQTIKLAQCFEWEMLPDEEKERIERETDERHAIIEIRRGERGKMKPDSVNIMGVQYSIEYCSKPSDVDIYKRDSLWGQIDYWTRTIRVFDNGRSLVDIWETILHEVLHGIGNALKLSILGKGDCCNQYTHDELDILALALTDFLVRNKILNISEEVTGNE